MKRIVVMLIFGACGLIAGCDTYQFAQKSLCQECMTEAKSRAKFIATTLLSSKNPTVKMEGEVLLIASKSQLLKVSCSGEAGGILETARKKRDGTMSAPHRAAIKDLKYLYCPKTLKKYITARK